VPDGSAEGSAGAAADREDLSATLLFVLGRTLALAHPFIPFVTEEIHSFMPGRAGDLAVHHYPEADATLLDAEAELEVGAVVETVRRLRNYRDSVGVPAGTTVAGRLLADDGGARDLYERAQAIIERLARFSLEVSARGAGPPASGAASGPPAVAIDRGTVELLPADGVDLGEAQARLEARAARLREEIARARGKLANEGFNKKAPASLVQAERDKLARYESELAELGT
jgi:valyl-tRNA synthetase